MAASDAFYQEIVAEVNAVLEELGTTYSVRGHTEYDPDQLERVAAPPRTVVGLVADQEMAVSMVGTGDGGPTWIGKKTLIMRADANPRPEEEVEVDGKWYPLTKAKAIQPADVVVVYMLDVSK